MGKHYDLTLWTICYTQTVISQLLEIHQQQWLSYNREFITQPIPISHSPANTNFESLIFFLKLMFSLVLTKGF